MSPYRDWWKIAIGVAAIAWACGLVWFLTLMPREAEVDSTATDAIIVLTGGSQRVENGLDLLAQGKGKKLFVSGVYHSTDVKALLRASKQPLQWLACCIELGHEADNTHGNAAETAAWMHAENFRSLRLVTASYHMPRSLLEFSRAMPDVRIVPNPVFPKGGGVNLHSALLILAEYMKYLFALARLELFGPAP
jgi:uncharacterized SAM-binding protein YcdF (DUF218 family)